MGRDKDRQSEIFYLVVCYPGAHNNRAVPGQAEGRSQELSVGFFVWMTGSGVFKPPPAACWDAPEES